MAMTLCRWIVGLVLALLVASGLVSAQSGSSGCLGFARQQPFASESLTVSNAVKSLTSATYGESLRTGAQVAMISTEADSLRFWADGSTPSASVGHLVLAGSYITLCGYVAIHEFRAIRVTGNVTIRVTYFKGV